MTEELITREIVERLMKIEGESRGTSFKNDADFVLAKRGKEGLKMVEEELKNLGYPFEYHKAKNLEFYPVGLRTLSLLVIKKTLDLVDEDIRDLGAYSARISFILRLYAKFFHSIPKFLEQVPKIWREYFTKGNLAVKEYNEKENYVILTLENFDLHPLHCRTLEGYFRKIGEVVVNSNKTTCVETKCTFKGGGSHEFLIKW